MQIEFPFSNYGQPFEKDYEMHGAKFTVRVLNVGYDNIGPVWLFALLVKGNTIEGGPYHPRVERELTDENVANHLASFWGNTQMVQDAQKMDPDPEWELNGIVEKCAKKMFEYFMSEEPFDYDIIAKHLDKHGWDVVLLPNFETMKGYKPGERKQTIVRFIKFPQHDGFYMGTYELERNIYTKF